jgi:hypothetical protein
MEKDRIVLWDTDHRLLKRSHSRAWGFLFLEFLKDFGRSLTLRYGWTNHGGPVKMTTGPTLADAGHDPACNPFNGYTFTELTLANGHLKIIIFR